MEARTGRLSLNDYHGLYEHAPTLAAFFLLTGLASVGFPGTFGFVCTELIVDGAVRVYPSVGMTVVVAAALNGIAVLQAYFRIFTGTRHTASITLAARPAERFAILALAALILGGGLMPQPGVSSRFHAAMQIVRSRERLNSAHPPDDSPSAADEPPPVLHVNSPDLHSTRIAREDISTD
jgi:NADH-quinone oxidoreductase subunit M